MNIGNPTGFTPLPHVPISFKKVYFFRLKQTRVHTFSFETVLVTLPQVSV